jgi:hypothetical protein
MGVHILLSSRSSTDILFLNSITVARLYTIWQLYLGQVLKNNWLWFVSYLAPDNFNIIT